MADSPDKYSEQVSWHWRNSMIPVRFFAFDARAAIVVPVLLIYARISTLVFTILVLLLFRYLERKGLTFPAAIRNFRSNMVGRNRPGLLPAFKKNFRDYG